MTRRTHSEQRKYEKTVLAWFTALAIIGFTVGKALATPWTDEDGNPNPECLSKHCHETGIPDPHEPTGGSYDPREPGQATAEVHKGFDCYYAPWAAWVYHTAARFNMSPQHDAAAKNEALDRLERLGDAVAMTKVCRAWQIAAGFKIAAVL
jgi:hypothetical protein